jgi:hypothetical protein
MLAEAAATLRLWAEEAERAWKAGEDIASSLRERFGSVEIAQDAQTVEKLEILNGFHSNAAGFRRWLELRAADDTAPGQRQGPAHPHQH